MRLSHKSIIALALTAISCGVAAQTLNSGYFTDELLFRHTMNPAYDNNQNYISVPGVGNLNVKLQGNFGYEDIIMGNPLYPNESSKRMTTFMNPYISAGDALDGFSSGNNRIIGDLNITLLSAGFKKWGGYNTIELNSKTSFGAVLPYELFEFAKNTGNKNYDIGDINLNAQSYVELAFGHSRQINKKLRLGAKVKFLFGVARGDMEFKDMKAELDDDSKWRISGKATADVSMKGFKYLSEEKEYEEVNRGSYEHVNDIDVDGAGLSGFGMAVDFGGIYKINKDWTVNASILDLGFISWSNDMRATNRAQGFEFDGFHDVSVTDAHGEEIDIKADRYSDQFADFANLEDEGDKGGRTTGIGATVNLGCEYTLPVYRKVKFGLLSSTRIRSSYTWTEGRLSANYAPLKWLDGGMNFAVNSFTASFGWVLNIHPKGYNFFIGMDHLLGKMSKECIPLSSNANLAVGMSITW